ncbi:MAG: hypothetical protein ABIS17_04435 [Casimicrobiaceae bacterium]
MTTKLDGALKREIDIEGNPWTLTITPQGFRLVPKGKRNGHELSWQAVLSGDAALATALNASTNGPVAASSGGGSHDGGDRR